MLTSNYERLAHAKKINPTRVQYLEDTVKALREYHTRAREAKKPMIWRLINAYELTLDKCHARMEGLAV